MTAQTVVGLDIGSTSICAVETSLAKDTPVINNFARVDLPHGVVVAGVVKNQRAVTAALRLLWTTHSLKSRNVLLGVSHQQVIVREVDITDLPIRERTQALPLLVKDVLPMPADEAVLDFCPLPPIEDQPPNTVHGLLVAIPKDAVLELVRTVEAAGLKVQHVDLSCFAALRAGASMAQDTEALLDIGANGTTIIVHTDGTPKIVRTIPRGGADLTRMLEQRLDLTEEEAEEIKCRGGLNPDPETGRTDARDVIAEALRPLITEVRSSFDYFAGGNPGKRIKRLALVGGGATLPGLADSLSHQLDVPSFLGDPLRRIADDRHGGRHDALYRFSSSAAVSIGLTLGAA